MNEVVELVAMKLMAQSRLGKCQEFSITESSDSDLIWQPDDSVTGLSGICNRDLIGGILKVL